MELFSSIRVFEIPNVECFDIIVLLIEQIGIRKSKVFVVWCAKMAQDMDLIWIGFHFNSRKDRQKEKYPNKIRS